MRLTRKELDIREAVQDAIDDAVAPMASWSGHHEAIEERVRLHIVTGTPIEGEALAGLAYNVEAARYHHGQALGCFGLLRQAVFRIFREVD